MSSSDALGGTARLDTISKLATLLGLLLPVGGATHREAAFAFAGDVPMGVGASLPLPQLVVLGFWTVWPGIASATIVILGWWLLETVLDRFVGSATDGARRAALVLRRITVILGLVYVGIATLLSPLGLGNRLSLVIGLGFAVAAPRLELRSSVPRLLVFAAAFTLVVAMMSALGPTVAGTYPANVHFAAEAGLPDGAYSVLADDGSSTWLLSCAPGSRPVRVRSELVATATTVDFVKLPNLPTLIETLQTGEVGPIGFVTLCP